jgi:serine protease AprX
MLKAPASFQSLRANDNWSSTCNCSLCEHEEQTMLKQPGKRTGNRNQRNSAVWGKRGLALCILTLSASLGFASNPKLSQDLEDADPNSTVHVIVKYKSGPSDAKTSDVTSKGGKENKRLHLVQASAYSMPASALRDLAADDDIEYIVPDRRLHAAEDGQSLSLSIPDQTINAPTSWWSESLGSGIGVAVIDSGIAVSQVDLQNKVVYGQSWVGGSSDDPYGHGTFVASIIAGSGAASKGSYNYFYTFRGAAPAVNLINLRVLDQNGNGKDSDVIAAIQTAIQLRSQYNIRVINLSLGRPVYGSYQTDPLCQAAEAAWNAGIVVVTAAGNFGRNNFVGNQGYGTITAPGNDPYVITVGAMKDNGTAYRSDDTIATYSSKGPTLYDHVVKPDLVAPGNRVIAAQAPGAALAGLAATQVMFSEYQRGGSTTPSNYYMRLSGTSMAAPMVSAAATLLLGQNPNLTPDQVKARLMKTASKTFPATSTAIDPVTGAVYISQYDIFTIGAGYLDIATALANNDLSSGSALSPMAVYNSGSGAVTLSVAPNTAFSNSVVWGSSVVWGASVVWGSNVVDANSVLWGSSVVWGSSTSQGFSVIWGTNATMASSVVWGAGTTSGSSVIWGADTAVSAMSILTQGEN